MNNKARELMEEAIRQKQDGELSEARVCYDQAIAHDLNEPILYYGLAKVNYLLASREEAISNYLRAAHLSYAHMKEGMDKGGKGNKLVDEQLKELDPDLKAALVEVSEYAPLLMLDENTARNLGHVLVDLSDQRPLDVEGCLTAYQRALQEGEEPDEDILAEMNRLDDEIYLPVGREYLAENILWEMLGEGDVCEMY